MIRFSFEYSTKETVRVPLTDAQEVNRSELRQTIASIAAGELIVAVCHDFTGRFGAYHLPGQYFQFAAASRSSGLKPVVWGSTTSFEAPAHHTEGMHQDDQTIRQVDAHYTSSGEYRAVVLDTAPIKTGQFPTNKDMLERYPVLEIDDNHIALPADIAEATRAAYQVHGGEGTLMMWGGKNGFSHPHQFNNGSERRLSRVFALSPRKFKPLT